MNYEDPTGRPTRSSLAYCSSTFPFLSRLSITSFSVCDEPTIPFFIVSHLAVPSREELLLQVGGPHDKVLYQSLVLSAQRAFRHPAAKQFGYLHRV